MKPLLSWEAPEFTKYKKGPLWFVLFAMVSLGLVFLAIKWKAFTMLIFLVLAAFLIIVYALKDPRKIRFSLYSSGIKVGETLHRYTNIKSFWIFYDPPEIKEISFRLNKTVLPYLSVPLGKIDPNEARKILLRFLPERKQKESIAENIARQLRF